MKIDLLRLRLRISFSISAQRSASDGSLGFLSFSIRFTSLWQASFCGRIRAERSEIMDRFSGVNSARRLNQVVDEWAKQQREAEAVVRERQKRSEELENAQMGSAEDIRKMLEMMEANQKEQAAEIQKNHRVTVISIVVAVVSAVFGAASFFVALIALLR